MDRLATSRPGRPVAVSDVRRRRLRRFVPAGLVAVVGVANIVVGLFPAAGFELVELTGALADRALVQTGRLVSVSLGLLLLLIARKLLQGSRSTWALAVALTAAGVVANFTRGQVTFTTLGSLLACASLLATRGSYRLRRPGRRYSAWWAAVAVFSGLVLFAAVRFAQIDTTLASATVSERLVILLQTTLFLPGGLDPASLSFEALAVALRVGLVVVLVLALWALWPRPQATSGDRDSTRRFVREHGMSSTAPLLTLPDNLLLSLSSGRALAAVGVHSGAAVCLGGPVARAGREVEALSEFTRYCEEAGWVPVLLGSDTQQRDIAAEAGYASLQIGVEAVLDVSTFSTVGKRRSNVRHSVTRAGRDGVSVLAYVGAARTARRTEQLARVSAQWLQDKGGPELGFTLGRFDPQRLDDQEVYVAVMHEGTQEEHVVGFVTWLPYDRGRSAVLDLMRRAQHAPPGVMEKLIVDSLADFAARGRERASLGGVPLATVDDGPPGLAQKVLAWTYTNGSKFYDAKGLFRFKDKFNPRWEPMWLNYPRSADLPRIALAAGRAFLPPHAVRDAVLAAPGSVQVPLRVRRMWVSVGQRFAELDRAQRRPSSSRGARVPIAAAIVTGALLVAAVQAWQRWALVPQFAEKYQWSGQAVLDGMWWRAITATMLIENAAAWAALTVSSIVLLVILERLVGPVTAMVVFAAGAVWGFFGTTLLLWAGSSLGWELATRTLQTTDYGPSSGTAAVGAAVIVVMRHPVVTVALGGGLLIGSALHHQVADVQHLVSFATVLVAAPVIRRVAASAVFDTEPGG